MYTSGCPKNQNRCCHRMGDPPPRLVRSSSFTSSPAGRKKLVPASRSRSSRTPAESSTPKPNSPSTAVTSHVQQVIGMRISFIPLQRRSRAVVMKLMELIAWPRQKIAILRIQTVWPRPCPGPATRPTALRGGYAVHPDIGPPPATKNVDSITSRETSVVQKESMLSTGNAISAAPN